MTIRRRKKRMKPQFYIAKLFPTGQLMHLLYDDTPSEMKRLRCIDKCSGEKPFGKWIRVRVTEA